MYNDHDGFKNTLGTCVYSLNNTSLIGDSHYELVNTANSLTNTDYIHVKYSFSIAALRMT